MRRIEKKAWSDKFEEVFSGKKNFEVRLNDFDISEGDILVLREWDPATKEYTGRELERTADYVLKLPIDELTKFWPREEIEKHGIQVISLK